MYENYKFILYAVSILLTTQRPRKNDTYLLIPLSNSTRRVNPEKSVGRIQYLTCCFHFLQHWVDTLTGWLLVSVPESITSPVVRTLVLIWFTTNLSRNILWKILKLYWKLTFQLPQSLLSFWSYSSSTVSVLIRRWFPNIRLLAFLMKVFYFSIPLLDYELLN